MNYERRSIRVRGVVQGVGFRPFVYRLASELALSGFVGNDSRGVFVEVEGTPAHLTAFLQRLTTEPPPLAHITALDVQSIATCHDSAFVIVHSQSDPTAHTLISPDLCICDDCLRELLDPTDRRYRYPFINCTHCGPRFTIIKAVPYDRPFTTMADFLLCPSCQSEYDDPTNRRFHAQPNACPSCGPHLTLIQDGVATYERDTALQQAVQLLTDGAIVAVKGLGGYHLACDATHNATVARLRQRKMRPAKPLAVMVGDLDAARKIAYMNAAEVALLTGRERPVVLLQRRADSNLSPAIAPGTDTIGVMLPYTPLHVLLMGESEFPLVMTSANLSGEPIIKDNDEALSKLTGIADAFLIHNRDIHVHCDDSVMRASYPVRRSRGYAPFPVELPLDVGRVLAVGGELKSTFCLTDGKHAFMSQHIGDMENLPTLHAFERAVDHMQAVFRLQPEYVICDRHPGYLSGRWASDYAAANNLPLMQVGHHVAHIASVMAENRIPLSESVIGFSFDGTGYGDDGMIWGGEVFTGGYTGFERVAHLPAMPLPGGDAAVKRPYRTALAYLWACGLSWDDNLPPITLCPPTEQQIIQQQLARRLNTPQTTSAGRLFDAVASLLGICHHVHYEGQAAIELEAACADDVQAHYPFDPVAWQLTPILQAIIADLHRGIPAPVIAAMFHNTLIEMIVTKSQQLAAQTGLTTVALSGGVFQNVRLLDGVYTRLAEYGFTVLTHRLVPPNDGGLALGQAVLGAVRLSAAHRYDSPHKQH